ncbi:TPA: nucleoside-diphosphate kinase [Candidatus Uhrbacteria bacterium]|nr:nucleoside-diphosphate kinase [Candidatus Uhrbacteria bacterium]
MSIERTVVLLKPDALQRDLLGHIITRFERKGLKLVGLKLAQPSGNVWDEHYSHHVEKPFYPGLKAFMMHGPLVAIALEGIGAINEVRKIVGATNPQEADAGTIRADFAMNIAANLIHASDGAETAANELKRFFQEEELFTYQKISDQYIVAN